MLLLEAINLQIAHEFVAAYPDFIDPFDGPPETTLRILIFEDIRLLLTNAGGSDIDQLAREITAVICSLPDCLRTNRITVFPSQIRDNVRDE